MKKIEDNCVGCTSLGLSCLGNAWPNSAREVEFCDECGECHAEYSVDCYGKEMLCEDCLKKVIKEVFNDLSLDEKIELLNTQDDICIEKID